MKVLWITNSPFPEIAGIYNLKDTAKGWVLSSANALIVKFQELNLAIASFYKGDELIEIETKNLNHFLIPVKVRTDYKNRKNDLYWKQIKKRFNPDVIHIHGSEYPYSYSFIRACGPENVVVSIQGLVSVIEKYYFAGLSKTDLLKAITFRDLIRFDTIFSQHKNLHKRGIYEKLLFQSVKHVIGRTTWDKVHLLSINSSIHYHHCNETLRPLFYKNIWNLNSCEKYSIFVSQAYYPIKGFHQLLKAISKVLKYYPTLKVYVAGNNFFSNRGVRINGYGNYINKLVTRYNLAEHIIFTGMLSEEAMCQQFLNSHIFICPSAIENSPNSVGEAQMLGVPSIVSYVGGTPDMVDQFETGILYRFEEIEMLAAFIIRLFSDNKLAIEMSEKSKIIAAQRHNSVQNASGLYEIYSKIINCD